jgi:signal transduction histidine kinase
LCSDASADAEHEWVEVRVTDTGCGIELQYQQRIFERFYQVPRAAGARASGQGLGLAIVKMIVELHGGQVTVESVPGQGSSFAFTLPCL